LAVDDAFGYWLSGLIDGEGSFGISKTAPLLTVKVRDDDEDLIRTIVATTGIGALYRAKASGPTRGAVMWRVKSKAEAVRLRDILDRYPLRSKKRRDYAIWREAVGLWTSRATMTPSQGQEMRRLARALAAIRRYEKPEVITEGPQQAVIDFETARGGLRDASSG
jgi:hypothetical protein